MDLKEVFNNTRHLSTTIYKPFTDNSKKNTYVYDRICEPNVKGKTKVEFTFEDTVTAIHRIGDENKCRIGVLDFANGIRPGGDVLNGAKAQEEDLCRCSNLYEVLIDEGSELGLYKPSREAKQTLDNLIFSEDILFFKDKDYNLSDLHTADVIVCPAPQKNEASDETVYRKMENIMLTAVINADEELILGNWGCGCFGNDPAQFGRLWGKVIREHSTPKRITFALPRNNEDRKIFISAMKKELHKTLKSRFKISF